MNKTFLLGVGAQKAGTTWLSKYIQSFDCVDTGCTKEYHIWDKIHIDEQTKNQRRFRDIRGKQSFQLWRMEKYSRSYFSYFNKLLNNKITLSADITPAYSGLNENVYETIKSGFERHNIDVKVIFLMRDPVERCWSAIRMHKNTGSSVENVSLEISDEVALLNYYNSGNAKFRTNYKKTITEIEKVFNNEDIYYGLYENMFSKDSIDSLSEFLKIPTSYDFSDKMYNVSDKIDHISSETMSMVAKEYTDIYQYCRKRFPLTANLWAGNKYIDR